MNIKKIIQKVDEFFTLSAEEQDEKKKKLNKVVDKLNNKRKKLKKEIKGCASKKGKEKLYKELKAIKKLIKKARLS